MADKLPEWVVAGAVFHEHASLKRSKNRTVWTVRGIVDARAVVRTQEPTRVGGWSYEVWSPLRFENMARYITPPKKPAPKLKIALTRKKG